MMDSIRDIFRPGGTLSRVLPGYEYREGQEQFASQVWKAFAGDEILLIEAGTGTGKSLGYLIPAMLWASETDERVVISTNTINLQEQLVSKDIPRAERIVGNVTSILVKGRSNYVCLRRLSSVLRQQQLAGDLLQTGSHQTGAHQTGSHQDQIQKILEWAEGGAGDGSKSELSFEPSPEVWQAVCVETDACTKSECRYYERCFFFRARRKIEKARILIVNHHLFLSDLAIRRSVGFSQDAAVLPEYNRLIVDEAHNLEDVATDHFGIKVPIGSVRKLLSGIHQRAGSGRRRSRRSSGLAPALAASLARYDAAGRKSIELINEGVIPSCESAHRSLTLLANQLELIAEREKPDDGNSIRITSQIRDRTGGELDDTLIQVAGSLDQLRGSLEKLVSELRKGALSDDPDISDFRAELEGFRRRCTEYSGALSGFLECEEDKEVRWIEWENQRSKGEGIVLRAAPVEIGPEIRSSILDRQDTVVFTSATLRVGERFDFFKSRIGLTEFSPDGAVSPVDGHGLPVEAVIPSPFEYSEQVLVCLVRLSQYPDQDGYEEAVTESLASLVQKVAGGTLGLFTSHAMVRKVALGLTQRLPKGFPVLVQGEAPRSRILETFRQAGPEARAVLLGTDSFWEGVDVPGESLSCVAIVRLPFRVPSDPVIQARVEGLETKGLNSFMLYTLPQAVLRFRQGFGRLIRTSSDRGVVVVYDTRILEKSYGRMFLGSLPRCSLVEGGPDEILEEVRKWFE